MVYMLCRRKLKNFRLTCVFTTQRKVCYSGECIGFAIFNIFMKACTSRRTILYIFTASPLQVAQIGGILSDVWVLFHVKRLDACSIHFSSLLIFVSSGNSFLKYEYRHWIGFLSVKVLVRSYVHISSLVFWMWITKMSGIHKI